MKCVFETGSTDCVCFATVGSNDPVTSALHIVVGKYSSLYLQYDTAYLAMYVYLCLCKFLVSICMLGLSAIAVYVVIYLFIVQQGHYYSYYFPLDVMT